MEEELIGIGLSKNEAKAYLAIAELGECAIGHIAKKSKVHRTNVYDAIERLLEKGLISYIVREKVKHYQITDPHNLIDVLQEKQEMIKKILPRILLLQNLAKSRSEAQILEGLPAVKRIIMNFLSYNEPLLIMGIPKLAPELLKTFIPNFHKERLKRGIIMKHIYNTDVYDRIKVLQAMPLTEVRILPSEFDSPISSNICGEEVVFIHWAKNPLVIRIVHKKLADIYKKYYDVMWNMAREPVAD